MGENWRFGARRLLASANNVVIMTALGEKPAASLFIASEKRSINEK
jgi:hypothetical protein